MPDVTRLPPASNSSAARRVALIGLMMGLASLVATGLVLWDTHRVAIQSASRTVNELGIALSAQISHRVRAIDFLLRQVQEQSDRRNVQTATQFRDRIQEGVATQRLLQEVVSQGQIEALSLLDVTGRVLSTSNQTMPLGKSFAVHDYYRHFASQPATGLYISRPLRSRANRRWTGFVVRPIQGIRSGWVGFAVATVDLNRLTESFLPLRQRTNTAIALLRRDGVILARWPGFPLSVGEQVPTSSPWYSQVAVGGGTFRSSGILLSPKRIISCNPVPGYPLVVDVSLSERAALAAWRRQAILIGLSELCVVSMFVILFRRIARQVEEERQQNAYLRAATRALQSSERRLLAYTEIASDWLWERDADMRITWTSSATPDYVMEDPGYRDMAADHRSLSDPAGDLWRSHRQVLETRRRFRDLRCRITERDGTEHYLGFHGDPLFNEAGTFRGYRGVARDITPQVAAEQELCEAKERSERAEASLRDAVDRLDRAQQVARIGSWEFDLTAGRWYWSKQMFALLGFPPCDADVTAADFIAAIHHDDRPVLQRWLADLGRGIPRDLIEVQVGAPGRGIKIVQAEARAILDASGTVCRLTGTVQDFTERRAIEYRLSQAQKREMLGTLTGGIAHDFNNVLGLVIGNLELLGRATENDPEVGELAADALAAAHRCRELILRLLAFARGEPLVARERDINGLIRGFAELLRQLLGTAIEPVFDLDGGLWPVLVDGTQLESALTNLVANARDAMPHGGRLTIMTRNVSFGQDHAVPCPKEIGGECVMIAVSDTGTGIPPEVMEHIFDPFFSTKPHLQGTGLGLAMVRGFVKQLGGHVSVESEPGRGSTFRLYLPRACGTQLADPARFSSVEPFPAGRTILGGDAEADARGSKAEQLRTEDFEVLQADSAEGPRWRQFGAVGA